MNAPTRQSQFDPLPARMLNEWVYCPRLAILEHVHKEWAESAETVDGKRVHRRVDKEAGDWPLADALEGREVARSLWLTAEREGISAKLDLVEAMGDGDLVRPVDYKRSAVPDVPGNVYMPEQVQLCAQALVLREHGYRVEEGAIWFAGSRRRVVVPITEELVARTRQAVRELNAAIEWSVLPEPLVNSPKCKGCSLVGICLPDEVGLLNGQVGNPDAEPEERLERRLVPARDDGVSLHVSTYGAFVGLSGEEIVVKRGAEVLGKQQIPLCNGVALYGGIQISTQALVRLMREGVPVAFFSSGGWFNGVAAGLPHGNIALRIAQHRAAEDPQRSLEIARGFVLAKLRNQRTLLRRNARARQRKGWDAAAEAEDLDGARAAAVDQDEVTTADATETAPIDDDARDRRALRELADAVRAAEAASDLNVLRGCEGAGAKAYFSRFEMMLRPAAREAGFDFAGRNRRPPTDPVNAALSFVYAMLVRELTHTALRVGLEPLLGFLHVPRHGRPALALDLMEEFRPILADSTVLMAFNNGELRPQDFVRRGPSCNLEADGRKRLIQTWERRLDQLVTHPIFGYRISYRRVLEVQARLLARHLLGELDRYPGFEVR